MKIEQIGRINVYIWMVINIVTLVFLIVNPELWKTPIWIILLFSRYILKSKEEIKNELKRKVPVKITIFYFLVALFIAIVFILPPLIGLYDLIKPPKILLRSAGIVLAILVISIACRKLTAQ
jgi:hypothetical protein